MKRLLRLMLALTVLASAGCVYSKSGQSIQGGVQNSTDTGGTTPASTGNPSSLWDQMKWDQDKWGG